MEPDNIRANLTPHYTSLNERLDDEQIRAVLAAPKTHKSQPLSNLLRAAGKSRPDHAGQVLMNTELAIRAIVSRGDEASGQWLEQRIAASCDTDDYANAAAALGEIRAFGSLIANCDASPVREGDDPTPDFRLDVDGTVIGVEVKTKQMNAEQAGELERYNATPPTDRVRGGIAELHVYPAGRPKPGESTAENVASKFAAIKPDAEQASEESPTVLWLDLQDEDFWLIRPSHARPYVIDSGQLFSGGLWHAFYGEAGTEVFEYGALDVRPDDGIRRLGFPGMFYQTQLWSGVILSFPRATLLLENHRALLELPLGLLETVFDFPGFDITLSWVNWPPTAPVGLAERIASEKVTLSLIARRDW